MSDETLDPSAFRAELDALLRRRDPAALRAFLIARGQWSAATTTDPHAAMWMMIAASPALVELHQAAEAWLRAHGRAAEAEAILGRAGRARSTGPRPRSQGRPARARTSRQPPHTRRRPDPPPASE